MRMHGTTFNTDASAKFNIEQRELDTQRVHIVLSHKVHTQAKTPVGSEIRTVVLLGGEGSGSLVKGLLGTIICYFLVSVLVTWVYFLCEK